MIVDGGFLLIDFFLDAVGVRDGCNTLKEKDDSLPFSSLPLYPRLQPLLDEFAIVKVTTRRKLLQKLCGQLFHQTGFRMAQQFANEQFAHRKVKTNADEAEHLKECGDFWTGLHQNWLGNLTAPERTAFENLTTDCERDAFRIIRSFAKNAAAHQCADFPIVRDDLGARIGITGPGAGLLVQRFCDTYHAILCRTQEYVPHKTAARYRYLHPLVDNANPIVAQATPAQRRKHDET